MILYFGYQEHICAEAMHLCSQTVSLPVCLQITHAQQPARSEYYFSSSIPCWTEDNLHGFFTCSEFTLAISVLTPIHFFYSNESFLLSFISQGWKKWENLLFSVNLVSHPMGATSNKLICPLKSRPILDKQSCTACKKEKKKGVKKWRCEVTACKKQENAQLWKERSAALFNFVN